MSIKPLCLTSSLIDQALIDYDAVAKVYNISKGATAKRFSRLKIALDAAIEATTNGKDDILGASKSPEKGTKRKATSNNAEDTGKKRKAEAEAAGGGSKKKAKIEEAVGEDEYEGGEFIKAEVGSEDDAFGLDAEIDAFYD